MSGTWGKNIKYTIFGESHGVGVGIVIDNLPPGLKLDLQKITAEMCRRKPGSSPYTSKRQEPDEFEVLSGVFNDITTGAPLCAFIRNTNHSSQDYDALKNMLRPGHADYTAFIKYEGFNDYRGGGHFSGRLTAAIVFAGAIAKQLLAERSIQVFSHIYKIGSAYDTSFCDIELCEADLSSLAHMSLPAIDPHAPAFMCDVIEEVKSQGDSVGGVIEAVVLNLPAGLGEPFFDSLESSIAHIIFSIPGVKGIEFGDGFALSAKKGSEANDEFYISNNEVFTTTNHCGGILGGISNGMPVIFKVAFKPTASIALEQSTINIETLQSSKISVAGRHDPCIVPRAIPVVEAAAAMAVLDMLSTTR